MAQRDYTVTRHGKLIAGRVRLAGKVCGPAQFVVGAGNRCRIEIDVAGESYYVMVKPTKSLWDIEVEVPIVAIGQLRGDTVWVESRGFHRSSSAVAPGLIEL